ncbi:MAG: peptidylprolyl isomerase [Parvularculaceae bacterium]|nr:peptidylprolyl isomerase [Parvularculaceae bacterium]
MTAEKTLKSGFKSIALAAIAGFAINGAAAQQGDAPTIPDSYDGPASAIAAVVNDSVITTYDVQQRMRMMLLSSGGAIDPQVIPQLQLRAVRDLVEERLKLYEAREFDVKPEDGEVDKELQAMATQSGLSLDDFSKRLEAEGISVNALRSQISSQIVWPRLVQGRYGNRVRVNDDDVEATIERMRADATQEQILVSEICIAVPSPDQSQAYYDGALQLLEQMRRGVPFAVVAQQFSACTTAAAGGDMGWVRSGELPPDLDAAVRDLPPGAVTNPIPTEGAFMILAVRDKREAVKQGEKSWTLAYASTPVSTGRAAARTELDRLRTSEACAGGRTLRLDLGEKVSTALIENVTLGTADERFRPTIENLSRGNLSEMVEADGYFHVFLACEVDEGLGIPSRSAVEDRLYSRQLERIAQQYLRDVERKSTVDILLATPGAPNG